MNKLILTFFYIGLIKKAPGTFGSLAAIFFWIFINKFFDIDNNNIFWISFLSLIFLYAIIFIKYYAVKVGQIDHKSIILDEILGQILTLEAIFYCFNLDKNLINFYNIAVISLCFITFRFFDITKIFPINLIDQKIKNAFGVMFDDFVAGIFAIIISSIILSLI